jgi:hypothetical protein
MRVSKSGKDGECSTHGTDQICMKYQSEIHKARDHMGDLKPDQGIT